MPMNDDIAHQDEEDKDFDRKLSGLYRSALLDEKFQQQVCKDLQTLSAEARDSLSVAEQAFVDDRGLSEAARARLLDNMAPRAKVPDTDIAQGKPTWWQKLLGAGKWDNSFLPGPVFSIPAAVMVGVVVGVLLPTLLSNLMEPAYQTRGGTSNADTAQTTPSQAGGIPDEVRQDPRQWLNAIADLVRQGKVAEARAELSAFDIEHRGYLPKQ